VYEEASFLEIFYGLELTQHRRSGLRFLMALLYAKTVAKTVLQEIACVAKHAMV